MKTWLLDNVVSVIIGFVVTGGLGFIIAAVKKILSTQKVQGTDIEVLKNGMSTLLQVNKVQTENITKNVPIMRSTIKSTRSVCYSQQENLDGNLKSAKASLSKAFELVNSAENALNSLSDSNSQAALAVNK